MKLLIADDNADMRKMLKSICINLFTNVLECDDGDSAVRIYRKENPDWVLMDIKMNRMDGITATREIKSVHPAAKIIIVSQYNDKDVIDEAISCGVIDFVNKEDLTKVVKIITDN
ncbi:MAG: response regulator [Ignavibacteriaceae bacterium]